MSSNSYTRSGEPLFYLSESEESSETQSSDSSETATDDGGSDAMDTDNDPSLYEFDPTDSDREQFHKPDPFPPREKFPYPEAHTPPTASSSSSSGGPQPSPSRPQPKLTYRGSTSHASNTVPTSPPPPPPAEPSSNLNLLLTGETGDDEDLPTTWAGPLERRWKEWGARGARLDELAHRVYQNYLEQWLSLGDSPSSSLYLVYWLGTISREPRGFYGSFEARARVPPATSTVVT
ncbi:hypothetical protein R3P38DRAFT_3196521 [Favolaschia claudopus]|uniref:Uncharacterized protein n=1 Tax=Favolaschia claudopus TaxID=2862362 RepID=A0AAW0B898_9AGAR